jgi:hypothetical protein
MATPKFESATECRLHAIALGMTGPESTVFVEKHRSPDWTTWADGKWKRQAEFAEQFPPWPQQPSAAGIC